MGGQWQRVHEVDVERLYAVPHEPERSRVLIAEVVVYAPRGHRVGRHYAEDVAARCLHIAIEVGALVAHERWEELVVPFRVFFHVGVNAKFQSCLYRLEWCVAVVAHGHAHGRHAMPFDIPQFAVYAVDGRLERKLAVWMPRRHNVFGAVIHIKGGSRLAASGKKRNSVVAGFVLIDNALYMSIGGYLAVPLGIAHVYGLRVRYRGRTQ